MNVVRLLLICVDMNCDRSFEFNTAHSPDYICLTSQS